MLFWVIAGALALAVGVLMVIALLRARRIDGSAAAFDVQVYRDQLDEVERDLARGVVTEDEAERVRLEVSRRILDADKAATESTGGQAPSGATWVAAGGIGVVVLAGSVLLYLQIGAPMYPDMPLKTRIALADAARAERASQAEVEARMPVRGPVEADPEYLDLVERLRTAVAANPNDLQGQLFLATNEARLGNYDAAHPALAAAIALKGDEATSADYADLADLRIMATGGYVSPEAEAALAQALKLDPRNGVARYYTGLLYSQTGRPDLAFRFWDGLLKDSTAQAPWVPPILGQIEEVAHRAGVRYTPPAFASAPAMPGPTAEQMEAAAEMSEEDRAAMIRGMVDGLSERLATEGGPPEDWARLIGALGVLGEQERAAAIWDEAQSVFAESAEAMATLRAAAQRAGVAE